MKLNSPIKMIRGTARKALTHMTAAELAEETKGAEDIRFEDTRPLSPAMTAAWDGAKRGRGRPRIGQGAEKVLISMEKRLLQVTDALARRKGLDRSKLVALAIREMLAAQATDENTAKNGDTTGGKTCVTPR